MIHFVGAGAGAPDLITLRGKKYLEEADVIIYAGSLVNPQLLDYKKEGCKVYNSAVMTLEEVLEVMEGAEKGGLTTVRLHTGDPCSTERSVNKWMSWRKKASHMIPAPASVPSAALHQHWIWNIRCRMCLRA